MSEVLKLWLCARNCCPKELSIILQETRKLSKRFVFARSCPEHRILFLSYFLFNVEIWINSNQKNKGAKREIVRNSLPSFELLWFSWDHCLAINNRLCSSWTKYLQSTMLFSRTSGSSKNSQKSAPHACSAQSLGTAEIWRPLQAEMVRSVMEAILERASHFAPFPRLGSRYRDITSTSRVGLSALL